MSFSKGGGFFLTVVFSRFRSKSEKMKTNAVVGVIADGLTALTVDASGGAIGPIAAVCPRVADRPRRLQAHRRIPSPSALLPSYPPLKHPQHAYCRFTPYQRRIKETTPPMTQRAQAVSASLQRGPGLPTVTIHCISSRTQREAIVPAQARRVVTL
jgi:hypothetical protein